MPWFNLISDFSKLPYYQIGSFRELMNYSHVFDSVEEARICPMYFNNSLAWYHLSWFISRDRNKVHWLFSDYFRENYSEPYYNSNYGYWWFEKPQAKYVINTLIKEEYSRQAVIIMNTPKSMMIDNDKVCTNTIAFYIRENILNMSINMRSSNFVNLTVDMFTFCFLYDLIYIGLLPTYKNLRTGKVYFSATSFHMEDLILDSINKGAVYNNDGFFQPYNFADLTYQESKLILNNEISNFDMCSHRFLNTLDYNLNIATDGR